MVDMPKPNSLNLPNVSFLSHTHTYTHSTHHTHTHTHSTHHTSTPLTTHTHTYIYIYIYIYI